MGAQVAKDNTQHSLMMSSLTSNFQRLIFLTTIPVLSTGAEGTMHFRGKICCSIHTLYISRPIEFVYFVQFSMSLSLFLVGHYRAVLVGIWWYLVSMG